MSEELFDKYLTGSLNQEEELEFLKLMNDETSGKELVEYAVRIHSYSSTAEKILTHDLNGEWKTPKRFPVKLVSAIALAAGLLIAFILLQNETPQTISSNESLNIMRNGKLISQTEILVGDTVSIKEESRNLNFSDGSLVNLTGELRVDSLGKNRALFLEKGSVKVSVTPMKKGSFNIRTKQALVEVKGTSFDVLEKLGETRLFVTSGTVVFSNSKQRFELTKGDTAIATGESIRTFSADTKKRFREKYLKDPALKFYMDFDGENSLEVKGSFKAEARKLRGEFTEGMRPGSKALSPRGVLEIPFSHDFKAAVPMTITAVVKKHQPSTFSPIITKGDSSWRLQLSLKGEHFHAAFGYHHGHDYLDSKAPAIKNKWQHITAVYTENLVRVYVDGEFDSELQTDKMHLNNHHYIRIGSNTEYKDRFFDGLIDEVGFYEREFKADEIKELYQLIFK